MFTLTTASVARVAFADEEPHEKGQTTAKPGEPVGEETEHERAHGGQHGHTGARIVLGAIQDFGSGVGRRLIVMNDFSARGIAEGVAVGGPQDAVDIGIVLRQDGFRAIGEGADHQFGFVR